MEERRKDHDLRRLLELESKIESLWYHHRNDNVIERLNELETFKRVYLDRAHNDAIFNDDEVQRIKELFDERAEVHAGRLAFRSILWMVGAAVAGAATTLLTYIGLKK